MEAIELQIIVQYIVTTKIWCNNVVHVNSRSIDQRLSCASRGMDSPVTLAHGGGSLAILGKSNGDRIAGLVLTSGAPSEATPASRLYVSLTTACCGSGIS